MTQFGSRRVAAQQCSNTDLNLDFFSGVHYILWNNSLEIVLLSDFDDEHFAVWTDTGVDTECRGCWCYGGKVPL